MPSYTEIKDVFAEKGCKLLTTEEEMLENNLNNMSKYKIEATCGHIIEGCYLHMFKYRGTGTICNACVSKRIGKKLKDENKELVNNNSTSFIIENNGYNIIKKYIDERIDMKQIVDGAIYSFAIKLKSEEDDLWLPIQLFNTTHGACNVYSFHVNNKNVADKKFYTLLLCIENEKIWIFDRTKIGNQTKLSIGIQKSKYSVNEVDKTKLSDKLIEIYNNTSDYLKPFDDINIPITENQQKELEYRKIREEKLANIKFEYPEMRQCVYDFTVNRYKIQEKIANLPKGKKSFTVVFAKSNKNKTKGAYHKDDNDFYWVNIPNKVDFYLFPAKVLFDHNILSGDVVIGKMNLCLAESKEWLKQYKYSYNADNINETIQRIFERKK